MSFLNHESAKKRERREKKIKAKGMGKRIKAMEIRRLSTADEMAMLAAYPDDSKDPLLECDYGQLVQWLADVAPRHPNTIAVFAAFENQRLVGYIAVCIGDMRPLYHFGTVFRFHSILPDATRPLGEAALEWGRERGVPRVMISVYDERIKNFYQRVFGMSECGWQLHRRIE